jgi:predicted PolB exonuclease-like 3'-5' exonuclease
MTGPRDTAHTALSAPPTRVRVMGRSYLVLDIETVPDGQLYVPPEQAPGPGGQAVDRPFPPLFAHRPIVIGVMWLDEQYQLRKLGTIGEGHEHDEARLLDSFSAFMDKYRPELVTYNGRSFDLPVLALRALRHGVAMPWYYQGKLR